MNIQQTHGKSLRMRPENYLAIFLAMFATTSARCQTMYSFETDEDFFAVASEWPAWQNTLERHDSERAAIQQCLLDAEACTPRFMGLRHILLKGAELTPDQQIRLVNRYINSQTYKDDRITLGSRSGNQWETLTEFLQRGGDCEDFAVAKYFILREFGFGAEDMRVVIGRESQRTSYHAMLAVRFDEGVLLLENDNTIRRNGNQDIDGFVYAINEQGIWDHEKSN